MKLSLEKQAYYEKHLSDWKRSGLTQKDYCRQEKIAYGSFKSWRSKLTKKDYIDTPSFIEAKPVVSDNSSNNVLVLQISLENGSRIGVSAQASAEIVEQVLKLLRNVS